MCICRLRKTMRWIGLKFRLVNSIINLLNFITLGRSWGLSPRSYQARHVANWRLLAWIVGAAWLKKSKELYLWHFVASKCGPIKPSKWEKGTALPPTFSSSEFEPPTTIFGMLLLGCTLRVWIGLFSQALIRLHSERGWKEWENGYLRAFWHLCQRLNGRFASARLAAISATSHFLHPVAGLFAVLWMLSQGSADKNFQPHFQWGFSPAEGRNRLGKSKALLQKVLVAFTPHLGLASVQTFIKPIPSIFSLARRAEAKVL